MSVAYIGDSPLVAREFAAQITPHLDIANVVLIIADGIISSETLKTIEAFRGKKQMIFLGPTFAGIGALNTIEQWCPYGR